MWQASLQRSSWVVLVLVALLPAADAFAPCCDPMNQYPGSSCLGLEDPFCNSGGGGGSVSCKTCVRTFNNGALVSVRCEEVAPGHSGYSECSVEGAKCTYSGAFCDVIQVSP